jgi:hypothetical protein
MAIAEQTVLALTLRPKTFDDVLGNEQAKQVLRAKLASGAVPRAFLLKGMYGCGKTTLAHIVAQQVQGPFFDQEPDVIEVNAANFRKIDDMRELAKNAGRYPPVGTYKVIILDECQQLTKEAQQILLKELEVKSSPTVWILCTTDPEKINSGVRDRCFPVTVEGLTAADRHILIGRAAIALAHTGPLDEIEKAVTASELTSPRKILVAFESWHSGKPAKDACNDLRISTEPEYFDIAMGVVYGKWDAGYSLPWIKDPTTKQPIKYKSVSEQLKALDEKLKHKVKKVGDEPSAALPEEDQLEEEELMMTASRDEVAQRLRLIVTTLLKNQVIKGGARAMNAALSLDALAKCIGGTSFGMEWAMTIGGLYRVHCAVNKREA